jgi:hypothetical protein
MRAAAVFLLLLLFAFPAAAQCGVPCQPVQWPLPTWPALVSPTPLADVSGLVPTYTPTGTITPGASLTPTATLTPFVDAGDVGSSLATLEFIVAGTVPPLANPSGTPFTLPDMLATAEADTSQFWGYSKGISESNFLGPFAPFATLLMVFMLTLFLVKGSTFLLPIGFALFGVIRKVVSLLLDFLPF